MGTNQHKVFSTYIMQGNFTLLLPATVSTVETVKAAQLLHNSFALSTNLPYMAWLGYMALCMVGEVILGIVKFIFGIIISILSMVVLIGTFIWLLTL